VQYSKHKNFNVFYSSQILKII